MRKLKNIRKDAENYIRIYNKEHKTSFSTGIQKKEGMYTVSIYENPQRQHFFQNLPLKIKSFSSDDFLKLNKITLKDLIVDLVTKSREDPMEDYDEPIHPGPGVIK